ncbi:MAG: two-component system sensor histidine kinase NtrB [Vicinamibacterales bacterium]
MSTSLRRKLLWLIAIRAVALTIVLGSAILVQIQAPGTFPVDPFFFLIGLTYALTALYAVTTRFAERHRWLIDLQLAGDAITVSAIVQLTGGVASYFSSLYALPVIAASITLYWRGGLLIAFLSGLLYGGIVVAQYASPLGPSAAAALPPVRLAFFTVGLNLFGLFAVAMLSGYLAEGQRRADARLQRASSRIADLQAFNQLIIDSLPSGLATVDADGRVLSFNRAAQAITGLTLGDALGREAAEVLQFTRDVLDEMHARAGSGGRYRAEFGFQRPDGRQIELGFSTAPFVTPAGLSGYLVTFQDVTQRKRQEREARVQQRLAAVGEMAAGMAHEIRNPLASMSGSMQVLRQELPLSEEQAQLMDIVLRESERLNDTIRSFLAYARPQSREASRHDLRGVLNDTATLLRNSAELAENHEVVVDAPDAPVWYFADEHQIRQIVWNLATNGLRAMPSGGRLRLSVAAEPQPGAAEPGAVVRVEDQGVGIPAAELDRIFQPFRGAFSRGTGLGLAIVHRIVTDYGGAIDVRSQPGTGTTVEVHLPGRAPAIGAPTEERKTALV